ncbi:MAG TPA: hypothetical protein ENK22_02550 [Persephonella sp.]|nr:hypothetical protein [Persephonella sp.]
MLSESKFEDFKNKLLEKYKKNCETKIKDAKRYSERKVSEAEEKGRSVYAEGINLFLKELENRKRKEFLKIQLEEKKRVNLEYKKIEDSLIKNLMQKVNKEFETFVICFSNWLKKNFKEGSIKTQERYFKYFEGYKKTKIKDKKVIYEKEDLVIELSPERIIQDHKEILKQMIFSQLKGS